MVGINSSAVPIATMGNWNATSFVVPEDQACKLANKTIELGSLGIARHYRQQ